MTMQSVILKCTHSTGLLIKLVEIPKSGIGRKHQIGKFTKAFDIELEKKLINLFITHAEPIGIRLHKTNLINPNF